MVSVLVLLGVLSYGFGLWGPIGFDIDHDFPEKLAVREVSINDGNPISLVVSVKSVDSQSIILTRAVVKDENGTNVAIVILDNIELPANTEETLTVTPENSLNSGICTLTLLTQRGGSFASTPFTKP